MLDSPKVVRADAVAVSAHVVEFQPGGYWTVHCLPQESMR